MLATSRKQFGYGEQHFRWNCTKPALTIPAFPKAQGTGIAAALGASARAGCTNKVCWNSWSQFWSAYNTKKLSQFPLQHEEWNELPAEMLFISRGGQCLDNVGQQRLDFLLWQQHWRRTSLPNPGFHPCLPTKCQTYHHAEGPCWKVSKKIFLLQWCF